MIRRRVVVHGLVQGVFFRDTCRQEAQRRHVTGWIRNADDGTVQAEFEGPSDAVEAMVAWCRQGPSRAQVERVEVTDLDLVGAPGFHVR
ncbi:MAG: acylphosphatase [Actinomycetota bacterium]|nr:acylphosphatase [Actinomycetota bacterium]